MSKTERFPNQFVLSPSSSQCHFCLLLQHLFGTGPVNQFVADCVSALIQGEQSGHNANHGL
eukprot:1667937-Amphidinium_carterae.1